MSVAPARDFRGYGGRPPAIRWPDDARVAVSVVVNIEEGVQLAVSQGDERIYDIVEEIVGAERDRTSLQATLIAELRRR